jgi:hypothetical protein
MQQISYASLSNADANQILIDLRDILTEARNFNHQHQITGALYYADGHFFQCLEGQSEDLEYLLAKLQSDPRHSQLKIFKSKEIITRNFNNWAMKFVGRNSDVQNELKNLGFHDFIPTQFTQEHADFLIRYLASVEETNI